MDYNRAFIKLYGAAGAAVEELYKVLVVTPELDNAIKILNNAITEVEKMEESGEESSAAPLTPSFHGRDCLGNGEHENIECCCDECDYYLTYFPDWNV